jgi:hypothetical protein
MSGMPRIVIAIASIVAAAATPCSAQSAGQAGSGQVSTVTITAGYEVHRDRLRYTFENRSNIDTAFLVPHAFTQTYVADNQWFHVSARYPVGGDWMETEFAITPERQTAGWDVDTFYDPNDDVVVSGTRGDVRMRSLRAAHWSEARIWGLPWRMGYTYRRDRSQFLPTDRILTHSNPPSELLSPTFGHETTISQVHEIPIEVSRPTRLWRTWSVVVGADLSPLVWARLTTILPDKYPGQAIVFDAKVLGAGGRIRIVRQAKRWPVEAAVHYGRTWSYATARQFSRDALQASIGVGLGR